MKNTFAERLQAVIDLKKISQTDLAKGLDVTESMVTNWLNGKTKNPRRTTVHKISEFFGCNIDWLANGSGEIFPQPQEEPIELPGEFERRKTDKILNKKLARIEKAVFKTQCPGYLDDLFDFIADNYGADKEGTEKFLKDLSKDSPKYRLWQTEKKLAKNGCEATPVEKRKANSI